MPVRTPITGPTRDLPIVGLQHHHPALSLVKGLPLNCPLILRAEPSNDYDINAIQVILPSAEIPSAAYGQINEELQSSGMEIAEILDQPEWLLGYIPRNLAAALREQQIINLEDVEGEFAISFAGKPIVRIEDK